MVIGGALKIGGGVDEMAASVVGVGEKIKFDAAIFGDTAIKVFFTSVAPEDAVVNVGIGSGFDVDAAAVVNDGVVADEGVGVSVFEVDAFGGVFENPVVLDIGLGL